MIHSHAYVDVRAPPTVLACGSIDLRRQTQDPEGSEWPLRASNCLIFL